MRGKICEFFFLGVIICCWYGKGNAQVITRFEQYNWEQGLSQNTVIDIIQDQQGYIWVGTQDGLNRFDGYRFQVFKHDPDDPHSLVENNIWTLFEGADGNIWIGTFGGLSMLDPKTGRFTNYQHDPDDANSLSDNIIKSIFEDRSGRLWVGTSEGGLNLLDRSTGRFHHYRHDPADPASLGAGWVWSILEDSKGAFWVGTSKSLCRMDKTTGKFTRFYHDPDDPKSLSRGAYRVLFEDRTGRLWIGSYYGLNLFDREAETFTRLLHDPADPASLSHNEIRDIQQRRDGAFWIATRDGLNLFDGRRFQVFRNDPEIPYSLGNDYVESVLIDRAGDLWVGTMEGLNRQDRFSALFGHIRPESWYPDASNVVFSIFEDAAGRLWVGTMEGLIRRNESGDQVDYFQGYPGDPRSLRSNFIWDIAQDFAGQIWVATSNGGISCFNPSSGRWSPCGLDPTVEKSLGSIDVYCIAADSKDNLWFGTERGLFLMDQATGRFSWKQLSLQDSSITRERAILAICKDRAGLLWLGGFSGLYSFDPQTGRVVSYSHNPQDTASLSHNTIYSIHEDRAGILWVGTGGGGLNQLDRSSGRFRHFREKHGLPNDVVNQILEDDRGRLWLSTNHGLSRFDPRTRQFRNWDAHNGLQGNEFNFGAGFKSPRTGKLFFGGVNGLNIFHPDSIRENTFLPPVVITGFRRYNSKSQRWETDTDSGLFANNRLVLHHWDDILEFEVAGLSFQRPSRNQYAYWLQGLNDDWIYIGNDRKITFTDLRPGTYTLFVKAANNDGLWNKEGISLEILVRPPWWLSLWAKVFYLIATLAAIYLLYRWRTKGHRRKIAFQEKELARERQLNEKLKQIDHLKDQFLANTSHELRTPLQGIIGLSEHMIERTKDDEQYENLSMIISSGRRLSSLVNDLLDFSKLKNYDIDLGRKPVNLHVLTDIVLKNNAPLVQGKDLQLINAVPDDLPAIDGDENRLQQVLYNLVGNAIKFTEKGYVKVGAKEFTKDDFLSVGALAEEDKKSKIVIRVEDTGIGIPENKRDAIFQEFEQGDGSVSREFAGTGLGLSISKRLVELHGGAMWVESKMGQGSTFFFTLPVSKEKATAERTVNTVFRPDLTDTPAATKKWPLPTTAPTGEKNNKINILVVDDEPINQQVFKNHLSGLNIQLIQAMNGEEAIRLLNLHSLPNERAEAKNDSSPFWGGREGASPSKELGGAFDLVLLDVMMPRLSGYEVCQKIREKYLPSELPVIMVTAKNQVQDLVQGLALGANDYLAKPFTKEEFLARVQTQLDLHRINEVTGRFVPIEFLRSLGRERITEVMLGDQAQREVTVLFSDIRDYTTLAESMTPEQNFKFVKAFHSRMGPVVRQHRGFVNQYLGDAIMAIFPESPFDALDAAVAMQKKLTAYNDHRITKGHERIRMGIGLHSGPLIMGIIGDQHRMDATTISDTVNTASRIESLTKHYGANILLSEESLDECRTHSEFVLHFRHLGKVLVKGKKDPVGLYECFDGDSPEIAERKLQSLPDFEAGLAHFFAKEFPEASAAFNRVLKVNPEDQVARLFLNKSSRYTHEGVPEDWTGVEVMVFK